MTAQYQLKDSEKMIIEPFTGYPNIFNYRSHMKNITSFLLPIFKAILSGLSGKNKTIVKRIFNAPSGTFQNSECWHIFKTKYERNA